MNFQKKLFKERIKRIFLYLGKEKIKLMNAIISFPYFFNMIFLIFFIIY